MTVKKERIVNALRGSIESEVPQEKLDEVQWVDISKIKEHPLNKEIYSSGRKGEDEELESNIKIYGLLQPIIEVLTACSFDGSFLVVETKDTIQFMFAPRILT